MKKILFVDDEPNILEGLERMLFPLQREWRIAFAGSGQEALDIMKEQAFDVIVSDMRMPGMDGAALLTEVKERYPDTVRFVLSGQSDRETTFRSVGLAHQFIAKPCNPKALKANVDSAFALRELLGNENLKRMISQADTLPALPKTYTALIDELQSEDASVSTVGEIVESDIGMTAKILQLVNSAFFGFGQDVASATQAVSLLGLDTVKALVLMVGVFSQADSKKVSEMLSLNALWRHSMTVGQYSQKISRAEKAGKDLIGDAYTAGVLHDAGQLLLAVNFIDDYRRVLDFASVSSVPLVDAEREVLGCTHAEVGAYLLGIWGLPDSIIQAVAFHHCPNLCPAVSFGPLTAVHAAEIFAHDAHGPDGDCSTPQIDLEYVDSLGLADRVDAWRDACLPCGQEGGCDQ
ncbi:MAG: HDOD domain-containing protein [Nitrospiraceae bacterium]|nr:HDOD domain-containing protein [Nitrospiraceae bacterium]